MRKRLISILLLVPVLLAASGNGMANSKGRVRGKKDGGYSLQLAGNFKGKGTASVTDTSVSVSADVTLPDGTTGSITFNNLALVNDRFQGSASVNGLKVKIYGRVDLPSASDDEESADQAVTGRVTATLQDVSGNMSRVVAIQDRASRGGNGKGNNKGNNGNNG